MKIEEVMLKMTDGIHLQTLVYFPNGDGKFPSLLARCTYGHEMVDEVARYWVKNGYVVVLQKRDTHSVNILFGQEIMITIAQLGFAFFLGILLAYIVLKANSLIPAILIHYLLDAIGPFFVYPLFELETDPFFILGAMIIGLGIIPRIGGFGVIRIFEKYLPDTFQESKLINI